MGASFDVQHLNPTEPTFSVLVVIMPFHVFIGIICLALDILHVYFSHTIGTNNLFFRVFPINQTFDQLPFEKNSCYHDVSPKLSLVSSYIQSTVHIPWPCIESPSSWAKDIFPTLLIDLPHLYLFWSNFSRAYCVSW